MTNDFALKTIGELDIIGKKVSNVPKSSIYNIMEKYLLMKKDLYTYFSKDFFKKKAEVEQISNNVQMIKRPYRAVAKEIKIYVHGIESIFILAYGIGSTYWVMSGAYALSGNLNRKLFY